MYYAHIDEFGSHIYRVTHRYALCTRTMGTRKLLLAMEDYCWIAAAMPNCVP